MQSPFLSTSVSEFWNRRWNPGTSFIFRRLCFEPLARRSPMLALFATFFLSAIIHGLLFFMATLQREIGLINASFFLMQPFFIVAERKLNVHRWPTAAGRAWTLAILAITAPLFVEPVLQVIGPIAGSILAGTLMMLAIVVFAESLFLSAALISCSGFSSVEARDAN